MKESIDLAILELENNKVTITPDILAALNTHRSPLSLAKVLVEINYANKQLLILDNIDAVSKLSDPDGFAAAVYGYRGAGGVLTQELLNILIAHANLPNLPQILIEFKRAKPPFLPDDLCMVITCPNSLGFIRAWNEFGCSEWFFISDIFSVIKEHSDPLGFARVLNELRRVGMSLTQEGLFDAIKKLSDPQSFADVLSELRLAGLSLTQDLFDAARKCSSLSSLANILDKFRGAGLFLTRDLFDVLVVYRKLSEFDYTLSLLCWTGLLTQNIFDAVKACADFSGIAEAVDTLKNSELPFIQDVYAAIKTHPHPLVFIEALYKLSRANLLTQRNFDLIRAHSSPLVFAEALLKLKLELTEPLDSITQCILNAVAIRSNPMDIADAALELRQYRTLCTLENFETLSVHPNPLGLAEAWTMLARVADSKKPKELRNSKNPRDSGDLKLTSDILDVISASSNLSVITEAVAELIRGKICTSANLNAVKAHPAPIALAQALRKLNLTGSSEDDLTAVILNAVITRLDPADIAEAVFELRGEALCTREHFNATNAHPNPIGFVQGLTKLKLDDNLTPNTFGAIRRHSNPLELALAFAKLKNSGILGQSNIFDAVKEHPNPRRAAKAFSVFISSVLSLELPLAQEVVNTIAGERDHPLEVAHGLIAKYYPPHRAAPSM